MAKRAIENNPKNILFSGAIGRAYTCLYTQRIAIKDELEHLTSDPNHLNAISNNSIPISKLQNIIGFFENNKTDDAWKELGVFTKQYSAKLCKLPIDTCFQDTDSDK